MPVATRQQPRRSPGGAILCVLMATNKNLDPSGLVAYHKSRMDQNSKIHASLRFSWDEQVKFSAWLASRVLRYSATSACPNCSATCRGVSLSRVRRPAHRHSWTAFFSVQHHGWTLRFVSHPCHEVKQTVRIQWSFPRGLNQNSMELYGDIVGYVVIYTILTSVYNIYIYNVHY